MSILLETYDSSIDQFRIIRRRRRRNHNQHVHNGPIESNDTVYLNHCCRHFVVPCRVVLCQDHEVFHI